MRKDITPETVMLVLAIVVMLSLCGYLALWIVGQLP